MKKILFFIFILPLLIFVMIIGVATSQSGSSTNDDDREEVSKPSNETTGDLIATKGLTRLGAKYVWGGGHSIEEIKNPEQMIFDCSSFVCWSHYQSGVDIGTWTTKELLFMGSMVSYDDMRRGDIILFKLNEEVVSHVGIYLGNDTMIHAPNPELPVKEEKLGNFWKDSIVSCRRLY